MILYEDVKAAYLALKARGDATGWRAIRRELGDVGSAQTIQEHLSAIRQEFGEDPPSLALVDDDPPDDQLAAEYRPLTPDPAVVQQHLAALQTQAGIVAARSHLRSLCAVLRCLEPALETVHPHLHRQWQAAVEAAGPQAALSMFRPWHQEPLDAILTASAPMLDAAEVMLSLLEKEDVSHGQPAA
jgi:hypothetical protein